MAADTLIAMTGIAHRVCALLLGVLLPTLAAAQTGENVAVVINDASPASQRIGEHYARRRGVPATNVIRLTTSDADSVSRAEYAASIEKPIADALRRHTLQDRVLYLVLTKGVPLRIAGTAGLDGTTSSVDSELTLLYRRMAGREVSDRGRISNPYYAPTAAPADFPRFTHRQQDIYLVTRLDAFTVEEALALIDRAQTPTTDGVFVFDQRGTLAGNPAGDVWLSQAHRRLTGMGLGARVVLEQTPKAVEGVENVVGYYGWGASAPQNRVRSRALPLAPGALAATFGSAEARTFREPPADWRPSGDWVNQKTWFEGAPEVLTGDLIRGGATGAAGHVADPFIQSTVRPDVLFPAYASGLNLAEAFYLAIPHLSWQTVVIGDPLCTIAPRQVLTQADIEDGVDADTELPAVFARQRLTTLQAAWGDVPAKAVSLFVQSEARLSRGDTAGARQVLEEASTLAPNLAATHLQLGLLYEQLKEFSLAQERYERLLVLQPANVIALNNLAYALAVHRKNPLAARPLAERAIKLAPADPTVVDTLAWVEYLMGNLPRARTLIRFSARGAPANPEIRLHAAFILAASAVLDEATTELNAALELDPSLRERSDVQELERRLAKAQGGPGTTLHGVSQ